jgi:hypothetical protein
LTSTVSIRSVSLCTWISCRILFWEKKTTNIEDWITDYSFKFYDINFRGLKNNKCSWIRVRVCCLMPLSTIFQLYHGGQFYWWRKLEYPGKTTDLPASNWQMLSHNVVSSTSRLSGVRTHNVSGDRYWVHR